MPPDSPDEIHIRDAEPDDWPAIAALLDRPTSDAASLRRWTLDEYDPATTLVAQAPDGQILGAAVAGIPRGAAQHATTTDAELAARISFVGVLPAHRRRGLGRRLLDAALDSLRTHQARRATLVVDGTHVEALALFRAAGFDTDSQELGLLRPPDRLAPSAPAPAAVRPLGLANLPTLTGLLIRLGVERARAPHDALDALTPAQLESWLQRAGTVAFAAWDPEDASSPLGLTWATRRNADGALRFIGVDDDSRRRGIGTALLAAVVDSLDSRPLRASLDDPGDEAAFFKATGFQVERITHRLSRSL